MTGCDLCEGAPDRTHRLGRGDCGCGRQRPRPPRGPGRGDRRVGGRDLLDRVVLRSLAHTAGLRGVQLVISDDHKGLMAAAKSDPRRPHGSAAACTSPATCWPMRASRAGASSPPSIATAFAQEDADSAKAQWRQCRRPAFRPKVPKLAVLMDEAEHDVLAYMSFPREHRQKLHSTNPIERLHAEVKRRTNVVRYLSQRSRHHTARRRHPSRAERRDGPIIVAPGRHMSLPKPSAPLDQWCPHHRCPPWKIERPVLARREPRRAQRSYTTRLDTIERK